MKTIRLILACVCLLFLCSCATEHPVHPQLPAEVTMNKDAGRGDLLIVTLRLESGEKLPFIVDTGTPIVVFDKSLEPKLGKSLGSYTFSGPLMGIKQKGGCYVAPKLYLGNTPLVTGNRVYTFDLKHLTGVHHIMGILGMDCLRHYCIQLNFETEKMRFLNPNGLDTPKLGQAFPVTFSSKGQGILGFFMGMIRPFIHHSGLLGGGTGKLWIDTGDYGDGEVEPRILRRVVRAQQIVSTTGKGTWAEKIVSTNGNSTWFPKCAWNGKTYTNLIIGNGENSIGLRFLARHLVTFDFPKRTMYLKRTSIGPLAGDLFVKSEATFRSLAETAEKSAFKFLESLKKTDRLPGWSKDDKGTVTVQFSYSETYPESETFDGRKKGDSSIYHYTITEVSKDSPWKLQRAWRTDAKGHLIEEYPVPQFYPR